MAKKKKADTGPSSAAAPGTGDVAAAPVDGEAAVVDAAFAAGNYQVVRKLATSASSPAAREKAQRLMPKMNVEPQQAMMAAVAIVVLLTVAALVLVRS